MPKPDPINPVPKGFRAVTPALTFKDARKAIAFYKRAFGAEQLALHAAPDGKIMHAEVRIVDAILMLCDENDFAPCRSAETLGQSPVTFYLYVTDCDKVYERALEAGARSVDSVKDQFWGDRVGQVMDPFGYQWTIATHVKDVSPENLEAAARAAFAAAAASRRAPARLRRPEPAALPRQK